MSKLLDLHIDGWLPGDTAAPEEQWTLAQLRITAGSQGLVVTELDDSLARCTREAINVSVYPLARWLLLHWWRLRWEPAPWGQPTAAWLRAHSLAAVGEGWAWPDLRFASDGELVHLTLDAETAPDVAAIRYLRNISLDVPAAELERAVDDLLDIVESRLAVCAPQLCELHELREELRAERHDPRLARECRWQALAGYDAGSAPDEWIGRATAVAERAGPTAGDEVLAVVPSLGLDAADAAISAMRDSPVSVSLDWAVTRPTAHAGEPAWLRGERLARELRNQIGAPAGSLSSQALGDLLGVALPMPHQQGQRKLLGGYRNGSTPGRSRLLVTKPREDSQRFYLARVIAAHCAAVPADHVLPVSNAATAMQKHERSFAQEFLCPWLDLDAFTNERGTDDDAVAEAAEHFNVSERLILSALVSKGKISRHRLELWA